MADVTHFARFLGQGQGRTQVTGFTPSDGLYVFVLGHDVQGHMANLNVGDRVDVSQSGDITDTKVVRFVARLRPPASVPSGVQWRFSLYVSGIMRASQVLTPGYTRDRVNLGANVSALSGTQTLMFRLALESA
jgi:hypothetical protein